MYKAKRLLKKLFTPITIMMVPHDSKRTINVKFPSIGIIACVLLWLIGTVYTISVAIDAFEYRSMKSKLSYYMTQFLEMKTAVLSIQQADAELKRLVSLGSKEKILENVDPGMLTRDAGSLDMEALKDQIQRTIGAVESIREYLQRQRDVFLATPRGWPVSGNITSGFGTRDSPLDGGPEFHSGLDISTPPGTPVRATADGIVSFSSWSPRNGNLVAIEHGLGYSTLYAHNRSNAVRVGQQVKRGDCVAYVGATGNATGPHVHYEVWKNGKAVNPKTFLEGAENVSQEK